MDRDGAAHTAGEALGILEGKHLPKGTHIQPCLAGVPGIFLPILDALHSGGGSLAEAAAAVAAPILRLNEDGLAQILHSIADLALDAHVGDLTEAVQVGAGAIAVQRVAVAVGAGHGDQCHKIDLVLQAAHLFFLLTVFGLAGCVQRTALQIVPKEIGVL